MPRPRILLLALLTAAALLAMPAVPWAADERCTAGTGGVACAKRGEEDAAKGLYASAAAELLLACKSGAPDGCAGLAAIYAAGRELPQDDARAVAVAREGCSAGSAPACANLGALLALGRGAPASADEARGLRERACAAGVAQACEALGTAAPEGAARHPLALDASGAPPGTWPPAKASSHDDQIGKVFADVYAASRLLALQAVPAELRPALGIADPRAWAYQPTGAVEWKVSELALAAWNRGLAGCADAAGKRRALVAWLSFKAGPGGEVEGLRVVGDDLQPEVEACLRAAAEGWDVRGLVRPGSQYLVLAPVVPGDVLPVEAEPPADASPPAAAAGSAPPPAEAAGRAATGSPPDEPNWVKEGYVPPRLADPRCVVSSIRFPEGLPPPASRVGVRFAVGTDGTVSRFRMLSPVTAPVANILRRAVTGCAWLPGKDAEGNEVAMWAILPFRFK
ncbi:MAG: hypothetical protein QM767_09765 [Anaeromyxobacter sp.]